MNSGDVNELRQHSDQLKALLDDPQPGLIVWKMALMVRLVHLAAYCGISEIFDPAMKYLKDHGEI